MLSAESSPGSHVLDFKTLKYYSVSIMMFNLHDFGYFESVLYNVQLVNTQPGIIDLRCHFS